MRSPCGPLMLIHPHSGSQFYLIILGPTLCGNLILRGGIVSVWVTTLLRSGDPQNPQKEITQAFSHVPPWWFVFLVLNIFPGEVNPVVAPPQCARNDGRQPNPEHLVPKKLLISFIFSRFLVGSLEFPGFFTRFSPQQTLPVNPAKPGQPQALPWRPPHAGRGLGWPFPKGLAEDQRHSAQVPWPQGSGLQQRALVEPERGQRGPGGQGGWGWWGWGLRQPTHWFLWDFGWGAISCIQI